MVQGKVSTPNYKVKKFMRKDKAEWIRVEQSHEAIIDEDTFRVTQELLKKDVRRGRKKEKSIRCPAIWYALTAARA